MKKILVPLSVWGLSLSEPCAEQSVSEKVVPLPLPERQKRTFAVDRLPDAPRATLRDDGITLIDGKPFFPIGAYAVSRREFNGNDLDRAFRDLKAAGFNFAHTYGGLEDDFAPFAVHVYRWNK